MAPPRKRDMAEYTHTVGTGAYQLQGAVPAFFTLRSSLSDHAKVRYRCTTRSYQEYGDGEFLWETNELIRRRIAIPAEGPVDWGPGRKLIFILDS